MPTSTRRSSGLPELFIDPAGGTSTVTRDEDLSERCAVLDRHRTARQGCGVPLLRLVVRLDVRERDAAGGTRLLLDRTARRRRRSGDRDAGTGIDGGVEHLRRGRRRRRRRSCRDPGRRRDHRCAAGRRPRRTGREVRRSGRRAVRRVAATPPARRAGRQRARAPGTSAICTRPTRRSRRRSTAACSAGRPTSLDLGTAGSDDVAPTGLRRPSRGDGRPRHLQPTAGCLRATGFRRRDRLAGAARSRRSAALARHVRGRRSRRGGRHGTESRGAATCPARSTTRGPNRRSCRIRKAPRSR